MKNNVLFMPVETRNEKRKRVVVSCVLFNPGNDDFSIPGFKRTQFPIRVGFELATIRTQAQLLSGAFGVDLQQECITHGQLYVAKSRAAHSSNK